MGTTHDESNQPEARVQELIPAAAVLLVVVVVWALSSRGREAVRETLTGRNRYERAAEELLANAPRSELSDVVVMEVRRRFDERDQEEVLDLLSRYGEDSTPAGRERVQLAILELSDGSPAKVRENVKLALVDFRDILFNAERDR